jgi:2-dehydro-3-deoxyphosphogluconate aldolase/(4S)-4-hydroxy-2-oxoglutarate aldolase
MTTGPSRAEVVRAIEAAAVVAVIRLKDAGWLKDVMAALADGGVRALEITMTVPGAVHLLREITPAAGPGILIGAGTVTDPETAARVIDAGARYVVSPVFRPAIIDVCHRHDVPALPGCFTPTEILNAWDAGADVVKVFPATALGPGFLKDVHGPLPQVKLMPTGGVTLDNAGDWLKAGACAVGVGSALVDATAVAAGRLDVLTTNAKRIMASIQKARQSTTAEAPADKGA